MKLEAVIWDLDGTLTDTAALHYVAWQQVMANHDVDYTEEQFLAGFGRNNFEILAEQMPHFSPAKIAEVSLEKETVYRRLLLPGSIQLHNGVYEWLAEFKRLGVYQVVGSSAPMTNIIAMLHVLEVGEYFHALLSGHSIPRGKPDPMLFLRCAAAVEADAHACVVIEDSIHGIEAAFAAGMPSIAVGKLALAPELEPYRRAAWPPCLASESLADVTLTQVHSLLDRRAP